MPPLTITFDYLCPFARIASEMAIKALAAGAPFDITFRGFSLSEAHNEEGDTPVWDREAPPSGVLALQWGLAVRDHDPERFHDAHLAIFSARHDHGRDINDPAVLREAVTSAGVDADKVEQLVAEGGPRRALAMDHTWAVETHKVFGVPTFIDGQRAVFVRLMRRLEDPAEARRTLERLMDLVTGWPDLNEFKASQIPR